MILSSSSSPETSLLKPSTQTLSPAAKKKIHHPTPQYKAAKKHIKELRSLGYDNFAQTGVDYWEPKKLNETDAEHNSRRQQESLAMSQFIEDKKRQNTTPLPQQQLPLPTNLLPKVSIARATPPASTSANHNPNRKRPHLDPCAESATEDISTLKADLRHERKARKDLTDKVANLSAQIAALSTTIKDLAQQLAVKDKLLGEKKNSSNQSNNPSDLAPAIKKMVEDLLQPILSQLAASAATQLTQKKQPPTQPSKQPQAKTPKQKPEQVTAKSYAAVTSAPPIEQSTAQIMGNGPASMHLKKTARAYAACLNTPTHAGSQSTSDQKEPTTFQLQRKERRRLAKQQRKNATNEKATPKKTAARTKLPASKKLDSKTILLLPSQENPNVLQKLQNIPEADPVKLGVKRHVPFPSGAVLVTCASVEQVNSLRTIASQAGISEKKAQTKPPEVRIHGIDPKITTEAISHRISSRYEEAPESVQLFPSKSTKHPGSMFAVLRTSLELKEKMSKHNSIRLGWTMCRIDTDIIVNRCKACGLLGHSTQKCTKNPMETDQDTTQTACKDCSNFNAKSTSLGTSAAKSRKRPTDHITGSKICPTLLAFKRKALPTRLPQVPETATS